MSDNIYINEIKPGMILVNKKNKRYVVIDTDLNGDDDYYSRLAIISEDEYIKYKGKEVRQSTLETSCWLSKYDYQKYYKICDEQYNVSSEKMFRFDKD